MNLIVHIFPIFIFAIFGVSCQFEPHFAEHKSTIVQLFEWKWDDIADECERFLSGKGYGGVQISPPNENLVVTSPNRPWWERYQPVSYTLTSRSGDEAALASMIKRCNDVGIRIYADVVFNHMTASSGTGTAGNTCDIDQKDYPGVPYVNDDFHTSCEINNNDNFEIVRNCELDGHKDLDQSRENVHQKIVEYLNHLIDLGVAGFRIDSARFMWPDDIKAIVQDLNNVTFLEGQRPFIYLETKDAGDSLITKYMYFNIGRVLELGVGNNLGLVFLGNIPLSKLENWGVLWALVNKDRAVGYIDNHDSQRQNDPTIATHKNPKPYKMATAFMLAHPYGVTKVMSSYEFDNVDQGPPQDENGNIIGPGINEDGTCSNGYVCEHRWIEIDNMVGFRSLVDGTDIETWWSNGDNQIAFTRGDRGFIVFTNGGDVNESIETTIPDGTYCDIVTGYLENDACSGKSVDVVGGHAQISLPESDPNGFIAIHVNAKLK